MIQLKLINFADIQQWGVDYQKKSKNFELIPDEAEIWGIYKDTELIGYFATIAYSSGVVEINQGYLKPEARNKKFNYIALNLLEKLAKDKGFKRLVLATNRAVGSYQKFMRDCGFELTRAEFAKEV